MLGSPDDAATHALILNENAVHAVQQRLPRGQSLKFCVQCDEPIPEARQVAMMGCRLCVECQQHADTKPHSKIRMLTYLL